MTRPFALPAGLGRERSVRRAPLLAGLALLAALGAWAGLEWRAAHERHRQQMRRYAAGVAQTLSVVLQGLGQERPLPLEKLEPVLAHLVEEEALRLAALLRDGRALVQVGEPAISLDLPGPVGEREENGLYVFWFALAPPPGTSPGEAPGRPGPPPFAGRPAPPGVPVLVTGLERALPDEARDRELRDLATKLGAATLGAFALLVAWTQVNRRRGLARRLAAEQAERARFEELSLAASGLAHETKNPLGIIRGLAQRIADDAETPKNDRERAGQIVDQADRAASRLGDFLSYARLRSPRPVPIRARRVLRQAADVLAPDVEAAGVPLSLDVDDVRIRADEDMLVQVLLNLLLNSLEASRPGDPLSILLKAHGKEAVLSVEDHGRGIAAERLAEVTKPYVSGRPGGHGLGLAIVQRIVEKHLWSAQITSEPGQGTRVDVAGIQVVHGKEERR